jgi:hypothetical protein
MRNQNRKQFQISEEKFLGESLGSPSKISVENNESSWLRILKLLSYIFKTPDQDILCYIKIELSRGLFSLFRSRIRETMTIMNHCLLEFPALPRHFLFWINLSSKFCFVSTIHYYFYTSPLKLH